MLRELWRSRLAVLAVLILAVLASTLVLYSISIPPRLESRKYVVGVATTSVLIDSPNSQLAEIAPEGSGDLGARADLLSRLMADGAVKASIARLAGLNPNALVGVAKAAAVDQPAVKIPDKHAPVLTTQVVQNSDGTELPIIQIEAQAADATSAAKLARAAVAGLQGYLDNRAAAQRIPANKRIKAAMIGAIETQMAVRGPKSLYAIAAWIFVFGFGCVVILVTRALVRVWRDTASGNVPAFRAPEPPTPVPVAVAPSVDVRADSIRAAAPQAAAHGPVATPTPEPPAGGWMAAPPRPNLSVAPEPGTRPARYASRNGGSRRRASDAR
jgi:hypothetical protein